MPEHYTILGGKVHIYKRLNSSSWQCATYLAGKNRRTTTKEDSLSKAKEIAEDWYLQLRGKLRSGELKSGKQFWEAAELYLREFDIITQGQRSPTYARGQHARTNGHLVPFFGNMLLLEITAGKVNEYRIHRLEECNAMRGKPPAHNTMHQEIVTLRQIFKTALRHGWIDHLRICQRHIARPQRFPIEHGSRQKSTSSFTRRRENARMIPSIPVFVGRRNNFTIMFCSPPIRASAPTRRCVFSFEMSLWSKMKPAARPFWKSKCVESEALAIARAQRVRCDRSSG